MSRISRPLGSADFQPVNHPYGHQLLRRQPVVMQTHENMRTMRCTLDAQNNFDLVRTLNRYSAIDTTIHLAPMSLVEMQWMRTITNPQ